MKRWLSVTGLIVCVVLTTGSASGEESSVQGYRVIAGRVLRRLQLKIQFSKISFDDQQFSALLLKDLLSAVLIPQQGGAQPTVAIFTGGNYSTAPQLVSLKKPDYERLRDFALSPLNSAIETAYQAFSSGNPADRENAMKDLSTTIASLPGGEQESARLLVGASLASLDPKEAVASAYVDAYQKYRLAQAVEDVSLRAASPSNPGGVKLEVGKPYAYGTAGPVTLFAPLVDQNKIETKFLGGNEYRFVPVREHVFVVRPDYSAGVSLDSDPTHLGVSAFKADPRRLAVTSSGLEPLMH